MNAFIFTVQQMIESWEVTEGEEDQNDFVELDGVEGPPQAVQTERTRLSIVP